MRKIYFYINAQTGKFVNSRGGDIDDSKKPELFLRETVILCISFIDENAAPYPLSASDSFKLSVDVDYNHDAATSPTLIHSENTQFNISGDWASIDRATGKISVRVNCNTTEFAAKIGSDDALSAYIEIKKFEGGVPSVILQDTCKLRNLVDDDDPAPTVDDPLYRTASAQDSIDNEQNIAIAGKANLADLLKAFVFDSTTGRVTAIKLQGPGGQLFTQSVQADGSFFLPTTQDA